MSVSTIIMTSTDKNVVTRSLTYSITIASSKLGRIVWVIKEMTTTGT